MRWRARALWAPLLCPALASRVCRDDVVRDGLRVLTPLVLWNALHRAVKPTGAVPTIEDEEWSNFLSESDDNVDKWIASLEE